MQKENLLLPFFNDPDFPLQILTYPDYPYLSDCGEYRIWGLENRGLSFLLMINERKALSLH